MVEQIIPLRYSDMKVLRKELDKLFTGQDWSIDTEMGQYVFRIPRYLSKDEIAQLDRLQRHYQRTSQRRPR